MVSGCGKTKEALSGDEFVAKMSNLNYQLYDYTESLDYAKSAYKIVDDNYNFTYIEGNRKYDVEGLFVDECTNVYTALGEDNKPRTLGGDNWTFLEGTTEDKYYYVSWIDNTYIYVEAPLSYRSEIESILKELPY